MAFQRIDLLPRYDPAARNKARSRWEDEEGRSLSETITEKIRKGAGEDFLQWDFEEGTLGFLEDYWDLAGIQLFNEEITFPTGDNFENIDFSYARFWHCIFIDATFPQTHFAFTRLYNVEFKNCLFSFASFYGATFEKCKFIDCDFVEENGFENCEILDTRFDNCFFNKNKFTDCKFDEGVVFHFKKQPQVFGLLAQTASGFKESLEKSSISGIYRGIKDGFLAGGIYNKSRDYVFRQHQAYTRFNQIGRLGRAKAYSWELIAGYGLRPGRVLAFLIGLFLIVFVWFAYRLDSIQDSLVFSAALS
ncbi:MAG: pentapeptide repeat-containing protein [Pseudolabrys sp.]